MQTRPLLVAFDLDDTLAPSKSALDPEMVALLVELLRSAQVCVISGGQFGQFATQFVDKLPEMPAEILARLHLMPTCGTRYYRHNEDNWELQYAHDLNDDEKSRAMKIVETKARELGYWEQKTWGPILEDRNSQITFSALGQAAPVTAKAAWDPDGTKKKTLREAVAIELTDLEVRSGGSTSIDITHHGIDKAYGITKLVQMTGISVDEMLFIGDRLDEGGNDFPVIATGIPTYAVSDWRDTADYLRDVLIPQLTGTGPDLKITL